MKKIEKITCDFMEITRKSIKLISRDERALFKSSPTGRCSSVVKIADDELILNKLLNFDDLYYMPIIEELNHISVYVERHLDASFSYTKSPLVMKKATSLFYWILVIYRGLFIILRKNIMN